MASELLGTNPEQRYFGDGRLSPKAATPPSSVGFPHNIGKLMQRYATPADESLDDNERQRGYALNLNRPC
eukprot:7605638-Prorocentrum_lima.AAC.1